MYLYCIICISIFVLYFCNLTTLICPHKISKEMREEPFLLISI